MAYIVAAFELVKEESSEFRVELESLKKTRLLREIFRPLLYQPTVPLKDVVQQKRSQGGKPPPEKTIVTPAVFAIAKKLFLPSLLQVVGTAPSREPSVEDEEELKDYPCHKGVIQNIRWVESTRTVPNHYTAVLLDGHRYEVCHITRFRSWSK